MVAPLFRKASKNEADRRILGKMESPTNNDKGVLIAIAAELLQKFRSAHLVSSANRVPTSCLVDYGYESLLGSTCGGSTGRIECPKVVAKLVDRLESNHPQPRGASLFEIGVAVVDEQNL